MVSCHLALIARRWRTQGLLAAYPATPSTKSLAGGGSRRAQRPVGSLPAYAMVLATVAYLGATGCILAGLWILAVPRSSR